MAIIAGVVLAYLGIFSAWVYYSLHSSKALLLGLAAILLSAPVAWLAASVGAEFNANACYSGVIDDFRSRAIAALSAGNSEQEEFRKFAAQLPVGGYETSCSQYVEVIDPTRSAGH